MAVKIKPYKVSSSDSGGFTETTKFHLLACGNINSNNNKFYCIEMQRNPSNGHYRLFTNYGRIEKTNVFEVRDSIFDGSSYFDEDNLDILESEYKKIIKKKMAVQKGKSQYETVDTEKPSVGSDNIKNIESVTSSSSKGELAILRSFDDTLIKTMIRRIWEENIHNITNLTTMKASSSGISSPLGPLTIAHIEKAGNVLNEIQKSYRFKSGDLNSLNAKYYSMIPHSFGVKIPKEAMIDNDEKFTDEFDLIEQLRSAVKIGGEDATDEQIDNIGFDITTLSNKSKVFKALKKQYTDSRAKCHSHMFNWRIKNIFQVDNNKSTENYDNLDARFKTTEFDLFHGSAASNILSIMVNGFYIPPSTASHVCGRMFGDGIYAASASTKALNYSTGYWGSRGSKYSSAYMFVVKFAMGDIEYPGRHQYQGASKGYDSIWAKKENTSLANDEFIVYTLSQAKITHLIQLEK